MCVNAQNPADTFQVVRNGDQFQIVSQSKRAGATLKYGNLEIGGTLLSVNLTYVKQTDTISGTVSGSDRVQA